MSCRCDLAAPCPTPAGRFTVGTSDKLVREVVGDFSEVNIRREPTPIALCKRNHRCRFANCLALCRLSNYLALGATFAGVIGITVMVISVRRQNRSEGLAICPPSRLDESALCSCRRPRVRLN